MDPSLERMEHYCDAKCEEDLERSEPMLVGKDEITTDEKKHEHRPSHGKCRQVHCALLNNYADLHESVPENRMTNETNHDKGEEGAILSEVGGSEDERHQNFGGGDDQAGYG